jgi:hypothetical protein
MRYVKALPPAAVGAVAALEPGAWLTPRRLRQQPPKDRNVDFDLLSDAEPEPGRQQLALTSLQAPWQDMGSHADKIDQPTGVLTAFLAAPETGIYEFATLTQPGSVLYVDGEMVVEAYNRGDLGRWAGKVALVKGLHRLRIDHKAPVHRKVWWKAPSMKRLEAIPDEALSRARDAGELRPRPVDGLGQGH